MKKFVISQLGAVAFVTAAYGAEPMAIAEILVDRDAETARIKPMNAVNNGPAITQNLQKRSNMDEFRAARIPYARTHDSNHCGSYGAPHIVDVKAVFPDFDADADNPANYDFTLTDRFLANIRRAGTQIFFRLGHSIEGHPKQYGVEVKDYTKWSVICEHIIRHCNEGWGWDGGKPDPGKLFGIEYWEIWNEPDLGNWRGSDTDFFRFYETAAKHLKSHFPGIKIGGPSVAGKEKWSRDFLTHCHASGAPLDFFSWHLYATEPRDIAQRAVFFRKMMDEAGFEKAESILNEWNFVKGWSDDWVYSLEVESGRFSQKGAAFIAATMADCQSAPVDMLMYYDARIGTPMNGMFDMVTLWPLKGYYPFYAWAKLAERGTQVECTVSSKSEGQFHAVAAKGEDGSLAVLVARYSASNDVTDTGMAVLRIPGKDLSKARCHVTDACRTYTEIPLEPQSDGSVRLMMQPDSFALFETD